MYSNFVEFEVNVHSNINELYPELYDFICGISVADSLSDTDNKNIHVMQSQFNNIVKIESTFNYGEIRIQFNNRVRNIVIEAFVKDEKRNDLLGIKENNFITYLEEEYSEYIDVSKVKTLYQHQNLSTYLLIPFKEVPTVEVLSKLIRDFF